LFAALLAILGVVLALYPPLALGPPAMQDLVPVEGRLQGYSVVRVGSRASHLHGLLKLEGRPGRFWNDALKGSDAYQLERKEGSVVRVFYAPQDRRRVIAGDAVESYGLWVNGVEIASPASSLHEDRSAMGLLVVMGSLSSLFGLWRFFVIRLDLHRRGRPVLPWL
jgi:hypothetical protein